MINSVKRWVLVAIMVSQVGRAQTASTAMPSNEEQIAAQEVRVNALATQMVELDASIEARIEKVIKDLKTAQDSPDSGTRLTAVKQETIKKLNKLVKMHQAERAKRLAAMRTGGTYLTKDQLTNDISVIEGKIESRVSDIVDLVDSLDKPGNYVQHSSSSNEQSEGSLQARRQDGRAGLIQGQVEKGIEADVKKIENENVSLKRDLLYKKGSDRELIEKQIKTNEELIQKRKAQADQAVTSGAGPSEREVSGKEAFRLEQSMKATATEIKADYTKLIALRTQYDRARDNLNLSKAVLKK